VQAINVVTEAGRAILFFAAAAVNATLFFWIWEEITELRLIYRRLAMIVLGALAVVSFYYGARWVCDKADETSRETTIRIAHDSATDVMTKVMYAELKKQEPKPIASQKPVQAREPQKPPPKTESFVFVVPGVWLNGNTWDFIVNHRGPDPSYHVEILFADLVKKKQVIGNRTSISPADINSYQAILNYDEIDPKGRGSIFAKQFLWTPPVADHEEYSIEITWRDGSVHQDLQIERVNEKWFWATQIKDRESGKALVNCKDKGFPRGGPPDNACFPAMTLPE
jgi:hypothetical protein